MTSFLLFGLALLEVSFLFLDVFFAPLFALFFGLDGILSEGLGGTDGAATGADVRDTQLDRGMQPVEDLGQGL